MHGCTEDDKANAERDVDAEIVPDILGPLLEWFRGQIDLESWVEV